MAVPSREQLLAHSLLKHSGSSSDLLCDVLKRGHSERQLVKTKLRKSIAFASDTLSVGADGPLSSIPTMQSPVFRKSQKLPCGPNHHCLHCERDWMPRLLRWKLAVQMRTHRRGEPNRPWPSSPSWLCFLAGPCSHPGWATPDPPTLLSLLAAHAPGSLSPPASGPNARRASPRAHPEKGVLLRALQAVGPWVGTHAEGPYTACIVRARGPCAIPRARARVIARAHPLSHAPLCAHSPTLTHAHTHARTHARPAY